MITKYQNSSLIDDIKSLNNDYLRWLKDQTILRPIQDNWVEITTPCLDRHNDCLQIYVRKKEGYYELTDGGYIIEDLELCGYTITPKRKALLNKTIAGFGIELIDDNRLTVKASREDFSVKKHNLLQAMLSANDLFYLADTHVISIFQELVAEWLDTNDIRNSQKIKFSGKTGYDYMFDFVIPKSKTHPERILNIINNPSKDKIESLLFKWVDTKDSRPKETRLYAVINDSDLEKNSPEKYQNALLNYNAEAIFWSKRDDYISKLVA